MSEYPRLIAAARRKRRRRTVRVWLQAASILFVIVATIVGCILAGLATIR